MSDDELLDTTNKIRRRLDAEYQAVDHFITHKVFDCLAYKTSSHRPEGRRPSVCPQWVHFHDVINFRESLRYRVGALMWHCWQLPKHHKEYAKKISELRVSGEEHHNEMRDAYFVASYLLDDVVFCSVSAFDYLAQLVFKLNFPERKGKKYWAELVKVDNHEDERLGEIIKATDDGFVYGLSRLRGRSIHARADVGGIELKEYFSEDGVTHTFNFTMPEEAMKLVSIFDTERNDFPIEPGSYLIALHSLVALRNILDRLGSFEYRCLYHPFGSQQA